MALRPYRDVLIPVLLGLVLLLPRAGGAHVHLCLDGQEAAVAVHAPDGGEHHADEGADSNHQDRDVGLGDDSSAGKASGKTPNHVALAATDFRLTLALAGNTSAQFVAVVSPIRNDRFLLPPLRGPPA